MLCLLLVTRCWLINSHMPTIILSASCRFATSNTLFAKHILLADPRICPRYRPFGRHLPFFHIKCYLLPVGCSPRAFCFWLLSFKLATIYPCHSSNAILLPSNSNILLLDAGLSPHVSPLSAFWLFFFRNSATPNAILRPACTSHAGNEQVLLA